MARGVLVQMLSPIHHLPFRFRSFPNCHRRLHGRMVYCSSSSSLSIDISNYKSSFARRMAMAGLKPYHRIALGVSGGPDSVALAILAAGWKTDGLNTSGGSNAFIDGLLAVIVDHGLRSESKDEADLVSLRVSRLGIRSEIARCDWLDGRPKLGHLQEAARNMRYQIFQKVCLQHKMDALLIAHHADDQAELFIIRLSRNSGVLGLAGMAFVSQLFSLHTLDVHRTSNNYGILLVRPLLELSKEDMYEICTRSNQEWVEDPTNQSHLFARNRIRTALGQFSSCKLTTELQSVIASCRKTRSYVDHICCDLLNQAVKVTDLGYAIIDLEILQPSQVEDISLSKFVALILQFISQRHKPVRGTASKLLLDYIRTFPCKTSLTAAGCYLCAAPGSKGTKILVCCSVSSPLPSSSELAYDHSNERQKQCVTSELDKIIEVAKSYSDKFVPDATDVQFLEVNSDSILSEAQKMNIISDSTFASILNLHREEIKIFKSKSGIASKSESNGEAVPLKPGHVCYFMKRFFVSWDMRNSFTRDIIGEEENHDWKLGQSGFHYCQSCTGSTDMVVEVRSMVDADWMYLSELSRCPDSKTHVMQIAPKKDKLAASEILVSNHAKLSAQRALLALKSIPAAARRSLPVLVGHEGVILSIPGIDYQHCPCFKGSATFKPTVPLGGGYTSYL